MNSINLRFLIFMILSGVALDKASGQCPDAPMAINLATVCNINLTEYTLSFEIVGGDPMTYTVTPPDGVISGNQFTSNPIPTGQGYSFILDDANHCAPQTIEDPIVVCNCATNAGEMGIAPIEVCGTDNILANYDDINELLDANDVLQFVLHTGSNNNIVDPIAFNSTPEFGFNPSTMNFGDTYFISAVAGDDDGSGNVDLSDPCLSVAAGTPVTWNELPTATMQGGGLFCLGTPVELLVNFSGQGPWQFTYQINGVQQPPVTSSTNPFVFDIILTDQSVVCLITVTDQTTGCIAPANGCITFAPTPPLVCTANVLNTSCSGNADGAIDLTCSGGVPPYSFIWSNGVSLEDLTNLPSGSYFVTVSDVNGCSSQSTFTIVEETSPICSIAVSGSINCQNPVATLNAACTGNSFPFTYLWLTNGNAIGVTANQVITEPGTYTLIATSATTGCTYTETITVTGGNTECGSIIGTVTYEEDGNCSLDAGETGIANWMVKATATSGEEYFDFTDTNGNYSIQAPPGDYTVEAMPPAAYWADCGSPISLTLEDANDIDTADFHWLKTISCPLMEVDISTPLLRRCLSNNYYVNYCNNGSEPAIGASIEITLDPFITILSASLPFTGPVNDVYTFDLGDVAVGQCGSFNFLADVSCDAVLGQTLCAEAHIYPDSLCLPIAPNWSGAQIGISTECTTDSVIFTITNIGTGDMTEPQGFIVVEDGVMLLTNDVQLAAGESITVSFSANGSTYNIIAEQVPGVPGFSNPAVFVEGCGTTSSGVFSTGFASQFPEDDDGPFISIDCHQVIGSYDPNDKTGYPLGYGNQHLIEPGQSLDYHIRFQNTGTDTAFFVKIQDVIDPSLDITTLRPGTSSHSYQLEIHQDTLVFIFENILLPDSNVNEPGSHGFVKFNIGQKTGLPLGTVIENEADIFFDFNSPVLTNKTQHKLGEHFIETAVQKPVLPKAIQCNVYPNPFSDEAVMVLQGVENQEVEMRLYDLTGRYLRSERIRNGVGKIKRNDMSAGLYFYEIRSNGVTVGQGKLAVE